MADKVQYITTNFTAGEFSPRLMGRVDIERYRNAAKVLANCHPVMHGGVRRRGGTIFVNAAKNATTGIARLVPFVKDADHAYMLEMGDGYIRFYKDNVRIGAPYEIATPYTGASASAVDYAQDGDAMYFFHEAFPIHRLRRFGDQNWELSPAPFTTTPFAEIGRRPNVTLTLSAATVGTGRTVTASAAAFEASDVGRAIVYQAGIAVITAYTSTTVVTAQITIAFASTAVPVGWTLESSPQTTCTPGATGPVGGSITLTLGAAGWRNTGSEDVGKFVRINGGLAKITSFDGGSPTTIANATVIKELENTTAAPALAWSLEGAVWNSVDGYPRTGTFHEQRLIAAGSPGFPRTVWGSRTAEPLDFTLGTDDDNAFAFTLANDEANRIAWVSSSRNLLVLTYGGEFSMQGGTEKPITPTAVKIKAESNHGAAAIRPVLVGRELVFVQRAGRKVRAMGYQFDFDGYASPDLTVLAEHITKSTLTQGAADVAYQNEPDQLLWLPLTDGRMVTCTLDRDQSVVGWARQVTDGAVESVATIPTDDGDQLWMTVRRVIGGVETRYIERMDTLATAQALGLGSVYRMTFDCGVVAEGVPATVWGGGAHLNGRTVGVLADGAYMGTQVVTGGQITLPRQATKVMYGIEFESTIEMLVPEVGTRSGSAQGQSMNTSRVILRVLETGEGITMNGQQVPLRKFGAELLDQPPPLYTGDADISNIGWDKGKSDIVIRQTKPLPMHVLAVIRELTVSV